MELKKQQQVETLGEIAPCLFSMSDRSYEVYGRDMEIQSALEVLARKQKANPILVGLPGVGKTSIVEGIVKRIHEGSVPDVLMGREVFTIDLALLGTDILQMKNAIDHVIDQNGILFIDEIHTVIGAGKTHGGLDFAQVLKPHLTNGLLTCIGATTYDEYKKYFGEDGAFARRFSKIDVKEPTIEQAISLLKKSRESYEKFHKVEITDEAIESAVKLSKHFDKQLPDIAFDLIDEACTAVSWSSKRYLDALDSLEKAKSECMWEEVSRITYGVLPNIDSNYTVTKDAIEKVISKKTGIPVHRLSKTDKEKLLELESYLSNRVIGQDHILEKVSDHIRASRTGVKRGNCSFLFLGSSGVGKTEMAKALNEALFDSDDIIRFDMSEYQQKNDVTKLIGAPAGYVGYDNGGLLTESVKQRPYSVILFDEIEKAHPDIFDTMLQVLDEGFLSDNKGVRVNFKNTVIIMTSNLAESNLENFFRKEFLNRIDDILTFNSLNKNHVAKIAQFKLNKLVATLEEEKKLNVEISTMLIDKIVDRADVASYGARDVDRIIHQLVDVPLSKRLLKEEFKLGQLIVLS